MSTPEEEKENRDLQQEERLALEAIYGPDAVQTSPISDDALVLVVNIDQDAEGEVKSQRVMILHVFLPATYPSKEPPDFEVSSVYCGSRRVDGKMLETIKREFHNMFQPGQVVLFEWISWLRDYLESEVEKSVQDLTQQLEQQTLKDTKDSTASEEQTAATSNNKPNGTEEDDGEPTPEIFSSEPLVDRKSVFVAHVAAVHSAKQVQKVMSKLLENKKIAKATHNIMAYRIVLDDGRVLQDNDDDGETAAGGNEQIKLPFAKTIR